MDSKEKLIRDMISEQDTYLSEHKYEIKSIYENSDGVTVEVKYADYQPYEKIRFTYLDIFAFIYSKK